jgi:hypothetical protein
VETKKNVELSTEDYTAVFDEKLTLDWNLYPRENPEKLVNFIYKIKYALFVNDHSLFTPQTIITVLIKASSGDKLGGQCSLDLASIVNKEQRGIIGARVILSF